MRTNPRCKLAFLQSADHGNWIQLQLRRPVGLAILAGLLLVAAAGAGWAGETSHEPTPRPRHDRCLAFDGIDDHATIPAAPSLAYPGTGGWSLDLWVKPVIYPTGETAILAQESVNIPGRDPYSIRVYPTHFGFRINGKQGKSDEIRFDLPLGVWSHIAATYDADGHHHVMAVFVNGEQIERRETEVHMERRIDPIRLGNVGREYGQPYFTGLIDDLHLWSRALSAEEVTMLEALDGQPNWRSAPDVDLKLWQDFNAPSDYAQILLETSLFQNHMILGTPDRSPNDASPTLVLRTPSGERTATPLDQVTTETVPAVEGLVD